MLQCVRAPCISSCSVHSESLCSFAIAFREMQHEAQAMEEPIHGNQREDIKQYLRRMERVIAQAEELHSHTVIQSNSSMRRSKFSRRRSYSGNGSCPEAPAGSKDINALRRSYCVATDGFREPAAAGASLPGKELTANTSNHTEALLDSGATLSDWMDEDAGDRQQPSVQRSGVPATSLHQPGCGDSQTSEDVLLDPEACLTFKIGSDGVPVSESDCDSVLLASPVRGAFQNCHFFMRMSITMRKLRVQVSIITEVVDRRSSIRYRVLFSG
jgi:hypothetical protein